MGHRFMAYFLGFVVNLVSFTLPWDIHRKTVKCIYDSNLVPINSIFHFMTISSAWHYC